jgi:hypothetical protein
MKSEQIDTINRVCGALKFRALDDTTTTITKYDLHGCMHKIEDLKDEILLNIPRDYTRRLRKGIENELHLIVCLRQLLRYTKTHRLVAYKKFKWNNKRKKAECTVVYKII